MLNYLIVHWLADRCFVKLAHLIELGHAFGEKHVAHSVDGLDARRKNVLRCLSISSLWHQMRHLKLELVKLGGIFRHLPLNLHRLTN